MIQLLRRLFCGSGVSAMGHRSVVRRKMTPIAETLANAGRDTPS
jgi:hypothetical protein